MRKSLMAAVLVGVAGLGLLASGIASASSVPQSPPYSASSSDGGTCGNQWAVDLYNRVFTQPAADPASNYAIVEYYRNGHFSTTAGFSNGACDGGTATGHMVTEGLWGTFTGNDHLFIQHGTFTAGDGTCNGHPTSDPSNPCTTASYVAYHYGAAATITDTGYFFYYHTADKKALGKWWKEYSATGATETDTGDIYTS